MEIRIIVLLGLISVYAIVNVAIFLAIFYSLSRTTSKITNAVTEFENSGETRKWIGTLQNAALEAVVLTETTKKHLSDFESVLGRTQETHKATLAKIDSSLERVAEHITTCTAKVKDAVAKPILTVMSFAAGIVSSFDPDSSEK